jgi:hypothetical protein
VSDSEGLAAVVRAGDRRRSLEALRDRLAADIDAADARLVPALAKQLVDVLRDIEGLREPEGSALDDLAARRAARISDATGTDST